MAPPRSDSEPLPSLDAILDAWRPVIGRDYVGYRNHVCRVLHCCFALRDCSTEERQKLVIAGAFHDLGIWTERTFDYLAPSIALASRYLAERGLDGWIPEIAMMIDLHHKLRAYRGGAYPLVEVFRRGDLVDVSWGLVRFGLPWAYVRDAQRRFPDAGFHGRLVQLTAQRFAEHPLSPIPVLKW